MRFKKVYIEITNICNLSCEFCPKTKRNPQFISKSAFQKILSQLKGYTKHLYFHVLGEPLLHPDIGGFLDICEEQGYKVTITTNGSLLKEEIYNKLFKAALRQINISLHSFEANNQTNALEDYLTKIIHFIQRAGLEKPELYINLRLWNLENNGDGIRENKHILETLEKSFHLKDISIQELIAGKSITLKNNVFLNYDKKFNWPGLSAPYIGEQGFCYGLRNQIAILVDGNVVPCCLDGEGIIKLGNVHENSIEYILESQRAKTIIKGFSERKAIEHMCQRCDFRVRFNN